MSRSRIVATASSVLVVASVVLGCGSKSSSPNSTTTTSAPTTPSSVATDSAVWPFVTDSTRYSDPVKAAHGFAVKYLGFVNPVVGAFMQGDGRSGEVVIRPGSTGPETTVIVREFGPDGAWWVLGAATANLQLHSPKWNASIASPVTLSGESTAFEATVNVEIRQDGTLIPLASSFVTGGSMGQIGPFSKAVRFAEPTVKRGAIVLKTLSPKDGNIVQGSVLRIQFTGLPNLIKRALGTGNLYQLRPYLARSVDYAIAASGAFGTVSQDGAIRQLSYFKDDRGPWNFAIPATTLESFKSGSYQRYLSDDTYFGVSPGKHFLSVRVNSAGQIDQIFMAVNTDLLK
jgi:hypothetical protein